MKAVKLLAALTVVCLVLPLVGSCLTLQAGAENAQLVVSMESEEAGGIINTLSSEMTVGDINGDGRITLKDLVTIKLYMRGYEINAVRQALDVNTDGRVDLKDIYLIKLILSGRRPIEGLSNTAVKKSYSADENALALTVASAGKADAFFDIDVSALDREPYGYAAVVWKNAKKAEVGFVNTIYTTESCTDITEGGGDGYTYVIFPLPANKSYLKYIEVKYDASPEEGSSVYIDSVIFTETRAAAESAAAERLAARTGTGDYSYVSVNLDTPEGAALLTESTNLSITCGSDGITMLCRSPDEAYAVLSLDSLGISADDYKYVVYTSTLPTSSMASLPTGKITFYAGDVVRAVPGESPDETETSADETETNIDKAETGADGTETSADGTEVEPEAPIEYSLEYSLINDGIYHSALINMTDAQFWSGTVHELKINAFTVPGYGQLCSIKSVVFCNSYEAAKAVCLGRSSENLDSRLLYDYGLYQEGEMQMAYRYYVPDSYSAGVSYPLLTILHGAGFRGTDGVRHLYAGFPLLLDSTEDTARSSIIFAPQCPAEYRWVESDWSTGKYSVKGVPESEPVKAVLVMLERLAGRFSVDRDRFYVTGYSMGGFGTWDLLTRHGEIFAAGMPLCGGGDLTEAKSLTDIPIHAFHGTEDSTVPCSGSRNMYRAIVNAGGTKIIYTALEGMEHNIWDTVYANEENMQWLFSHKLSDRT